MREASEVGDWRAGRFPRPDQRHPRSKNNEAQVDRPRRAHLAIKGVMTPRSIVRTLPAAEQNFRHAACETRELRRLSAFAKSLPLPHGTIKTGSLQFDQLWQMTMYSAVAAEDENRVGLAWSLQAGRSASSFLNSAETASGLWRKLPARRWRLRACPRQIIRYATDCRA